MSNNTPACANEYLLNDVIRKEWGWSGYGCSLPFVTAPVAYSGGPLHVCVFEYCVAMLAGKKLRKCLR